MVDELPEATVRLSARTENQTWPRWYCRGNVRLLGSFDNSLVISMTSLTVCAVYVLEEANAGQADHIASWAAL